jgi:hypothetical protein
MTEHPLPAHNGRQPTVQRHPPGPHVHLLADRAEADCAQAEWLQAVMRGKIHLQVSTPEPHDPRIVDVDARELAMGC